jgi:L-threonylcarbamoyladenylate synthase
MTKILSPTAENIAEAAQALARGEVVAIPTETVYGLAGSIFREEALARIFESKERPTFDPLIVHVGLSAGKRIEDLQRIKLVDPKNLSALARERASKLMLEFWPGPLTLVLPKQKGFPDLATSGLQTVAVRMPRHPLAQALIAQSGTPLAAPSANRFGRISPTTAQAVFEELNGRIGMILDGGACEVGLESTVVRVEDNGDIRLLRPGGTAREELEKTLGYALLAGGDALSSSPGTLESHYAPKKPLILFEPNAALATLRVLVSAAPPGALGFLFYTGQAEARAKPLAQSGRKLIARTLSESGDTREAARRLFAEMRALDASEASALFAELPASREGLGFAIADRLSRAAKRR